MINIAIWGAGKFGEFILKQIENNNEYNVSFVIDNNENKDWLRLREGEINKSIVSMSEFCEKRQGEVEFVLLAFLGGTEVLMNLEKKCKVKFGAIKNCVFLRKLVIGHDILSAPYILWDNDINVIKNKAYMNHLQCNIIDSCNLDCKGCSHFANLFSQDNIYEIDDFKKDISRLSSIIYLEEIVLVGGEPFLNRNILEYIEFIHQKMPFTSIMIVSNGLLIPSLPENILAGLANYKVSLIITEYPPTTQVKNRIQNVIDKYDINCIFTEPVKDFGKNLDLSGENDPNYAQRHCRQYLCQFLRNGKIYKCPFSALHSKLYECFGILGTIDTGVDLYQDIDWKQELKKLFDEPIELCKYCGKEVRFEWECHKTISKEDWLV